jgi:TrmH family RNA methyltransferase
MIDHDLITSPANARVRAAARLRDADSRHETGLTLVDGRREVARAARAGVPLVEVYLDGGETGSAPAALAAAAGPEGLRLDDLAAGGTRIAVLSRRAFERIAFGDRNEGIVAVARFRAAALDSFLPAPGPDGGPRPVLVVEGVEKPGNLGAILRTADAAGLAGVIVCDARTDAAHPAVIRASLGTVFAMPLAATSTAEAVRWCGARRRRVVAATPAGRVAWHEARLAGATAIVLGSEAHGLSAAWARAADAGEIELETVRLPMAGAADSLNVSATAAVLAYEAVRQQAGETRPAAGRG